VHFWNQILQEGRRFVPDVKVAAYAYSDYRFPPRRETVLPGVVIGFVPELWDANLDCYYAAWKKAGMTEMFLRPNDFWSLPGAFPLGIERKIFDNFKTAMAYGIIGTDYDSIQNYWPSSGFAYYLMGKVNVDPSKDFQTWENEYTATFGEAAVDVRNYLRYWRTLYEESVLAKRKEILAASRSEWDFTRGVYALLGEFYRPEDFDATDAMLKRGLTRPLDERARRRLETLQLANTHARLTVAAVERTNRAKNPELARSAPFQAERLAGVRNLLAFRAANKKRLHFNWITLFAREIQIGDVVGVAWASSAMAAASFTDTIRIVAVKTAYPPNIDGTDNDETWKNTPVAMIDFDKDYATKLAVKAHARIAWDTENLYLFIRCEEPAMGKIQDIVRQPGGPVWNENDVEVFLAPTADRMKYYQLAINTLGTLAALAHAPAGEVKWDSKANVAVQKSADGWTVELALPWANLSPVPSLGTAWGINLCRVRRIEEQSEYTCLSPTFGSFHTPARFGVLVFQ
jgi:hypothetical protein